MPRPSFPTWRERVAPYLVALLVFAGHLAYGANSDALALVFAALWFALLAVLALSQPWFSAAVQARPLAPVAIPFILVLTLAAFQLTPWALGGPHPVWQWAPSATPIGSIIPYATRLEILKLLALAAAFLVGFALGADDDRFRLAMRAILTLGLAFAAWAFLDHAANPTMLFGDLRHSDPTRLSAAFGSSNTPATLFGALALLNIVDLTRTYQARRPEGRFHASHVQRLAPHLARPLVALALSLTCLILTFSRAGIAATAVSMVALVGMMAFAGARRRSISAPVFGVAAVLLAALVGYVLLTQADMLQQRFLTAQVDSANRGQIFAAHWAAALKAPVGGYGLGSFTRVNGLIMNNANVATLDTLGAAHNVYIQWAEQAGVPGAAAMFATVTAIAATLATAAVRRRRMRSWALGIMAVLLLFLLHGASDFALEVPSMALWLSVTLGLGCGLLGGVVDTLPRAQLKVLPERRDQFAPNA
jgi:O-antigen ligase